MQHRTEKLLWDLLDSGNSIRRFVSGMSYDDYLEDEKKTQSAVERKFEIVGEVLKRLRDLDEEVLSLKIPEYYKIIGMRNIIANGYDKIEVKSIWDHVQY